MIMAIPMLTLMLTHIVTTTMAIVTTLVPKHQDLLLFSWPVAGQALFFTAFFASVTHDALLTLLGRHDLQTLIRYLANHDHSLNFGFMLVQAFYGWVSGSLGLLSDTVHMFFDCLALVIGLGAAVASKWPTSPEMPFGWGKLNVLAGFGNGIFLMWVSVLDKNYFCC